MKQSASIGRLALTGIGAVLVATIILTLVIATLWVHDVWKDREHTVVVKSETPVYTGSGNESCGESQLTLAQPGATFRVRRIRYWKNCATLDVVLPDGRKGYIVPGDGAVSISPPLH